MGPLGVGVLLEEVGHRASVLGLGPALTSVFYLLRFEHLSSTVLFHRNAWPRHQSPDAGGAANHRLRAYEAVNPNWSSLKLCLGFSHSAEILMHPLPPSGCSLGIQYDVCWLQLHPFLLVFLDWDVGIGWVEWVMWHSIHYLLFYNSISQYSMLSSK